MCKSVNTRPLGKTLATPHLKLGTSLSPIFSVGLLRGFAYCPAMRPIRTTGIRAPHIRIREKERISPIFAVMFSYGCHWWSRIQETLQGHTCVQASKLSAQSPAWRRNALFSWTWESWYLKRSICQRYLSLIRVTFWDCELASDGATSGGRVAILDRTLTTLIQRTQHD